MWTYENIVISFPRHILSHLTCPTAWCVPPRWKSVATFNKALPGRDFVCLLGLQGWIQNVAISTKEQKDTKTEHRVSPRQEPRPTVLLVYFALTNSQARSLCPWSVRPAPLRLGSSRLLSAVFVSERQNEYFLCHWFVPIFHILNLYGICRSLLSSFSSFHFFIFFLYIFFHLCSNDASFDIVAELICMIPARIFSPIS